MERSVIVDDRVPSRAETHACAGLLKPRVRIETVSCRNRTSLRTSPPEIVSWFYELGLRSLTGPELDLIVFARDRGRYARSLPFVLD